LEMLTFCYLLRTKWEKGLKSQTRVPAFRAPPGIDAWAQGYRH